jgi:AcrR family transcriptional regulator
VGTEPPVPDPLADLPQTARRMVETTRRLLIERGYAYLSLENIAAECELNKTAIRYYFKNKAGLMELVVDSWVHDNMRLLQPLFELPGDELVSDTAELHAFMTAKEEMSENTELYLAFFELLPAMLRDTRNTSRIAELYEWGIAKYARLFAPSLKGLDDDQMLGFARLLAAVVDGLGVQHVISPQRFHADAPFEVFAKLLAAFAKENS